MEERGLEGVPLAGQLGRIGLLGDAVTRDRLPDLVGRRQRAAGSGSVRCAGDRRARPRSSRAAHRWPRSGPGRRQSPAGSAARRPGFQDQGPRRGIIPWLPLKDAHPSARPTRQPRGRVNGDALHRWLGTEPDPDALHSRLAAEHLGDLRERLLGQFPSCQDPRDAEQLPAPPLTGQRHLGPGPLHRRELPHDDPHEQEQDDAEQDTGVADREGVQRLREEVVVREEGPERGRDGRPGPRRHPAHDDRNEVHRRRVGNADGILQHRHGGRR